MTLMLHAYNTDRKATTSTHKDSMRSGMPLGRCKARWAQLFRGLAKYLCGGGGERPCLIRNWADTTWEEEGGRASMCQDGKLAINMALFSAQLEFLGPAYPWDNTEF